MASITNRIKTIVGADAKPHQFVGRLLFYAWASNLPVKLFKKIFGLKSESQITLSAPSLPPSVYSVFDTTPSDQPLISILIPTKNQTQLLQNCLDSIVQKSVYGHYEIIVIDNQSTEAAFFSLMDSYRQQMGTRFTCITADFEFNFSSLINLGFQSAAGEHIVLLNNDTQVLSPRWLNDLLAYSSIQEIGAVGCKLLYPDHTIQHAGIVVFADGITKHIQVGASRNAEEVNAVQSFAAVTAAAMMVKRSAFVGANGFDPEFKVEFNDIDFCLRLQKLGLVNIYVPTVELIHYESVSRRHPLSSPQNYKRFQTEQHLLYRKHCL